MNECCQNFYEGRVQGVGFRVTIKHLAAGYDVTGWIRNLADGRVEMQVAGAAEEIEDFLEDIRSGVLGSHIVREERHPVDPPPAFRGFLIRD